MNGIGWVFQGNPQKFGMEEYVSRCPELIYWRTPKYASQISLGDTAFIWRSGPDAGAIAIGHVAELPTKRSKVKHPEALGDDLWWSEKPDSEEPKTGIHLSEVRLSLVEGMIPRLQAKAANALSESALIKMPNGTVFRLSDAQNSELQQLWGFPDASGASVISATEGEKKLRAHYRRERSSWLKTQKLQSTLAEHGSIFCELCNHAGSPPYPQSVASRIFEVHHRRPLSESVTKIRTTLADLSVLCANCHRIVHATLDVEQNFASLQMQFKK